jgi:hypothetical protein
MRVAIKKSYDSKEDIVESYIKENIRDDSLYTLSNKLMNLIQEVNSFPLNGESVYEKVLAEGKDSIRGRLDKVNDDYIEMY